MRIPIIRASEELPRRTVQGAGRVEEAISGLGSTIQDIGRDLAETQQRINIAGETARAEIAIEKANADIVSKLRLTPNHETYFEDWLKNYEQTSVNILQSVKGVKAKANVEGVLNQVLTRETRTQKDYANKLWINTQQAEDVKVLDEYANFDKLETGLKYLDSRAELYTPKELENLKIEFRKLHETTQQELSAVIAAEETRRDPVQAVEDLQKETHLPHLKGRERQRAIDHAIVKAEQLKTDKQVTGLLADLKTKFPDVQERIKHIESVEFLKSLGDKGAKIQNELLSYTLREWQTKETEYKTFSAEKIGKATVKIFQGLSLSAGDTEGLRSDDLALLEKTRDYQIRQDRAERRFATTLELDKAREGRVAKKEKSDSIAGLITEKILTEQPIDVTKDIYAEIPNGLLPERADQLVKMAGKLVDPAYKLGIDALKQAFPDKDEYGRAVLNLKAQVDTANAKGEQILDIAETIAAPQRKSQIKEFLKRVWEKTSYAPGGIEQQDSLTPGKDQYGFVLGEERNFSKGVYTYMGGNRWRKKP